MDEDVEFLLGPNFYDLYGPVMAIDARIINCPAIPVLDNSVLNHVFVSFYEHNLPAPSHPRLLEYQTCPTHWRCIGSKLADVG